MRTDLPKEERKEAIDSLRRYLADELELEVSELQGGLFLDFILQELGPFSYNRGIADAKAFFSTKVDDLGGICFEEPLTFWMKSKRGYQVRRKPG